jgi:hypothetical protein
MAKINKLVYSSKLDDFNSDCHGICDLLFEYEQMKDRIFNSYIYLLEQNNIKEQIMTEFPESCLVYIYKRKFAGKIHLTVSQKQIELKKGDVNNIVLLGKIRKHKDKLAPIKNSPIKSYLNTNYLVKENLKKKTNCDVFDDQGKKCKKYIIRNNDVLELNESCNIEKAVIITTDGDEIDIKDYVHMYRKCTTCCNVHCKKDKIEKIIVITSAYDGIFDNANRLVYTHYENTPKDDEEPIEQHNQDDKIIHSNFDLTVNTDRLYPPYLKHNPLNNKIISNQKPLNNKIILNPNSIQKSQRLFNSNIVRNGNSFMMGFNSSM